MPIVLANILQTAYQITDTLWVGRLSAEAVAAVSLCFPISFLLIAIGGGLPIAGSVLIAQYQRPRRRSGDEPCGGADADDGVCGVASAFEASASRLASRSCGSWGPSLPCCLGR